MDFKKDMNLMGIIGLIGAIIMIVGVFLAWLSTTGSNPVTYSGWDIQNNVDSIKSGISSHGVVITGGLSYAFVPLVSLICGIISLIIMIVPTVINNDKLKPINNVLGIIALILAIIVVICGIMFYTQTLTALAGYASAKLTETYSIGIGFWLVLVGGIITVIGGIMPILKNKGIIKF